MTLAALAFAAGAAALQLQAELPGAWWAVLVPLLGLPARRWRFLFIPLAFVIGFFWAAALAHLRMADWLAPELEGRDLEVVGVVSSLPALGERSVRFEFEVESAPGGARLPHKLLLSWHRTPLSEEGAALLEQAVHPGERWLFTVRLRRPHGNVNPYGFDYEAWLLERGVGATGYVRQRGERRKLGSRNNVFDLVEKARESVRDRFQSELGLEAIAHGLPSFFDQVRNAIPRSNLPSLSPLPYVPRGSDAALEQPSLVVEAVRIDVPMGPAQPHREQPALARMHRLLEQRRTLLGPRRAMP